MAFVVREAVEAAGTMAADDSGCVFSVDVVPLLNHLFAAVRQDGAKLFSADANAKIDARAMAKLVDGWHGESVMKGVDVERLLAEFRMRSEQGRQDVRPR